MLLYFSDLSQFVCFLIKYNLFLNSLLEVEICVLTKCFSSKFNMVSELGI
jgi:hypothetical protein